MDTSIQEHSLRLARLFRWAVLSSSCSKVSGLALQAVALPLIFRRLSVHEYAVFLLISAALSTLAITQMGAGPGLTNEIARSSAGEDRAGEASVFASAWLISAVMTLLTGVGLIILIHAISARVLFGNSYAQDQNLILHVGDVCIALLCSHVLLGTVDSALAGYHEQVFTNSGACVANFASMAALLYVCRRPASIASIVFAMYSAPVFCKLVNLIILLVRRPYLLSGFFSLRLQWLKALLSTGLSFWVVQLSSVVEMNAGTFILGHASDARAVAVFGVAARVISLLGSAAGIVTQPLWPRYVDAVARRDYAWVNRTFGKLKVFLMSISSFASVGLATLGPWLFLRVLHIDIGYSNRLFLFIFAIYLTTNIWTHLYYVSLMGVDAVGKVAAITALENGMMVLAGILLVPHLGVNGMAFAYLGASIALPLWLLPKLMADKLKSLQGLASICFAMANS